MYKNKGAVCESSSERLGGWQAVLCQPNFPLYHTPAIFVNRQNQQNFAQIFPEICAFLPIDFSCLLAK